jgi:hypothetical protein
LPGRSKDKYGETHSGKHKYISVNFQKDWSAKGGTVEVTSKVEIDQGYTVEIESNVDLKLKDKLEDKQKEKRKALIKKNHPDRGGTDEALKKVLDEYGD